MWLARNCKSLHREVSNWQVANTWRLFLHTYGLCEYSFFMLLMWEQDLSTTTVFLSPFILFWAPLANSSPNWLKARGLKWLWSFQDTMSPDRYSREVQREAQKSCGRSSTASADTRDSKEVRPVVNILTAGTAVVGAYSHGVFQLRNGLEVLLLIEQLQCLITGNIWGKNLHSDSVIFYSFHNFALF